MAARLLVTAWKPDLILATEHLEPHVSHCRKKRRVSFCKIVSGERHVWQVTYSLMYLDEGLRNVSWKFHEMKIFEFLPSKDVFNLLGLETTFDDQLRVPVH